LLLGTAGNVADVTQARALKALDHQVKLFKITRYLYFKPYNAIVTTSINFDKCTLYQIVIPVVVGSSPIGHPSKINDLAWLSSWAFSFLDPGVTPGLHSAAITSYCNRSD
jgi:hypothetical protein